MNNPLRLFPRLFSISSLLLILSLAGWQTGSAQQIRGTVTNSSTGEAVPFSTVSLLSLPDSQQVGGTLTAESGSFALDLPAPGSYIVSITVIGFQPYQSQSIDIVAGKAVNLGDITLQEKQVMLNEVDITAQAAQMELDLDKRVFRVDQDLALAGSNADDILQNLPSVEVDPEGAVSLRGSQNVRILINGKPSGLVGVGGDTDGLAMLQGNMIEKIEVITNPSARYDAEGEVGIINIVLKKEKRSGFNGSFNAGVGYPSNENLGANINYRSGKINWFANLNGNHRKSPGGGGYYQEQYQGGELLLITDQTNDRIRSSIGGNFRTGADILFNEYNTLTVSGLISRDNEENITNITYTDYAANDSLIGRTTRDQIERELDRNLEFSGIYTKTFPRKDREWTSTIQYQLNDDTELADIEEVSDITNETILQQSSNTEDEGNWLIQSDYIHPFGAGNKYKFETGTRITLRHIENDYLVEQQNEEGIFEALPDFDNFFTYDERIYAGYGIFSHKMNKFSYQLGLRAEYTDLQGQLIKTQDSVVKQYLNWFPSTFLSYKFDNENTLQLSYSRRLSRPRFRSLLPFSNFSDARNLRQGNPDLDPEYTHSFELGYLSYWETGSVLSSVYYRYTTGVFERITIIEEDGITYRIPVNLSTRNAIGIEFSGSQDLTSWWSLSGNVNVYGFRTEGQYESQTYEAEALAMNARLNSRMTLPGDIRIQISGNYNAPTRDPQGRRLARYDMDLGASMPLLNDKATLAFSVRDVFNSNRWRAITDTQDVNGNGFYRELDFQWRVRQIAMTFTYRLNQDDRKRDRGDRGPGGDFGGDDF